MPHSKSTVVSFTRCAPLHPTRFVDAKRWPETPTNALMPNNILGVIMVSCSICANRVFASVTNHLRKLHDKHVS